MKKLVMAFGLSLALSSAVSADPSSGCPDSTTVLTALTSSVGDSAMKTLITSQIPSAGNAFISSPPQAPLPLVSTPVQGSPNCHYGIGTTPILTIYLSTAGKAARK
ncbi:MAG: hypothetical protein HYX35_00625 [Proteobacteria bacterium]|nr:hypothetical protein [Pseudomonadota bacterium]